MNFDSPFRASPDQDLGRRLRARLEGPDPEGFRRRLAVYVGALPELDSQWDVLARWARPRVFAAAMVAAFLLGFALVSDWRSRRTTATQMVAALPATMLLGSDGTGPNPLIFSVLLEER